MEIKRSIWCYLFVWASLVACETRPDHLHIHEEIIGLASPIRLSSDTTEVFLKDYLLNPETIARISLAQGLDYYWDTAAQKLKLWQTGERLPTLSALRLSTKAGGIYHIMVQKSDKITFEFALIDQNHKEVAVKGEMNAWNSHAGAMSLDKDGKWKKTFVLDPGSYQYKFVVDGRELSDPSNPDSIDNTIGGFNSLAWVGNPNAPRPAILTSKIAENGFYLESDAGDIQLFALWQNQLIEAKIHNDQLFIPLLPSMQALERSYIRVFATSEGKEALPIQIPLHYGEVVQESGQLSRRDKERTIMYFLMVDRFRNADPTNDEPVDHPEIRPMANHLGGDLAGVTEKIKSGYFEALGMNTIWLSPIVQNAQGAWGAYPEPFSRFSSYHGYWPISFNRVDYRYGTENELKELVAAAHARDMNVLLDFVANHVHEEHPYYQANPEVATELYLPDGSLNTERWDDHRLTTWFDVFMPTLDLERQEVAEMLSDSAIYWLKEFQIDGFRHDATKHIPHSFWRTLTAKVKDQIVAEEDRPIIQIGETYGSPELISSYINSGELDSQFDFNLYDDLVATFARAETPMHRLAASLEKSLSYYGQHHLMGNMTGNQDRARFMAYADGSLGFDEDAKYVGWTRDIQVKDPAAYKRLQSLMAFLMTAPGIPVVYYGDEIGMTGAGDPDNRRMMRFDGLEQEELQTRNVTAELARWRTELLPLSLGQTVLLHVDESSMVMARIYFEQMVIIAFNKGLTDINLAIPTYGRNFDAPRSFSGTKIPPSQENSLSITIPSSSFELISNQ